MTIPEKSSRIAVEKKRMNTKTTKDIKGGAGFFCKVSIAVPSGIVHSTFPAALFNKRIIQSVTFTAEFKEYLLVKQEYKCHYCGCDIISSKYGKVVYETDDNRVHRTRYFIEDYEVEPFKFVSIDHKVPLCKGGSSTEENLVACCHDCNGKKSTKDYWRFVNEIRDRNKSERVNEDSAINK